MDFAKLHGLGNDFVLVDLRDAPAGTPAPDAAFARRVCDRHRGVGADGVLTLLPAPADPGAAQTARMVIHNPDGSRPEMCGNGARCAALWIATGRCTAGARATVLLLTDAGPRRCVVEAASGARGSALVEMGPPVFGAEKLLPLAGAQALAAVVSMGNPHRVLFVDAPAGADAPGAGEADDEAVRAALDALCAREGQALSRAEDANLEFVQSLGHQRFAAAVWERGAGATQACGTGACAVAAAAIARGLARAGEEIEVGLPGGALWLRLEGGELRMRGPAELVFTGTLAE